MSTRPLDPGGALALLQADARGLVDRPPRRFVEEGGELFSPGSQRGDTNPTLEVLMLRALFAGGVAVALLVPGAASARAVHRDCAGAISDRDGTPVGVTITGGTPSCATAKRVMRQYLHSLGSCQTAACTKTHAGWTCASAYAGEYPHLATCSHRRQTITATAIVD